MYDRAGASLDTKDDDGCTPLHAAVRSPDVVAALVRAGADVNARDNAGDAHALLSLSLSLHL